MAHPAEFPSGSLLHAYQGIGYTDCYVAELPFAVTIDEFIEAFYTTPLFKLERVLLGAVMRRPSSDAQARELALGLRDSFAVWSVEARANDQLIVAALRTRSWLAIKPNESRGTRLYFGSAVVARTSAAGTQTMGLWFWALSGFHKLYSQALLRAARRRLLARPYLRKPD